MTRAVESLRLVFFICASTPLSDISNGCYFHHYKSLRGGEDVHGQDAVRYAVSTGRIRNERAVDSPASSFEETVNL